MSESPITVSDLIAMRDQLDKAAKETAKRLEKEARVERAMEWPK